MWRAVIAAGALAAAGAMAGCGTGSNAGTQSGRSGSSAVPSYVTAPFTHQQHLVEAGARLFISEGCSACHSISGRSPDGPSFARLAGNHVTLADGRRVLVDERFLREALLDPHATAVKGYSPATMLIALQRLHLSLHPKAVEELAAFIEQIGPEDG